MLKDFPLLLIGLTLLSSHAWGQYRTFQPSYDPNTCVSNRTVVAFKRQTYIGASEAPVYKQFSDEECIRYPKLWGGGGGPRGHMPVAIPRGKQVNFLPSSTLPCSNSTQQRLLGRRVAIVGSQEIIQLANGGGICGNEYVSVNRNDYHPVAKSTPDFRTILAADVARLYGRPLNQYFLQPTKKYINDQLQAWQDLVTDTYYDMFEGTFLGRTEADHCTHCVAKRNSQLTDLIEMLQRDTNLKNPTDFKNYICNYLESSSRPNPRVGERICERFKQEFIPLSQLASKIFSNDEIDWRYANCLWLQESSGRASAMAQAAHSRAAGLGQHTGINIREIHRRIQREPIKSQWKQYIKQAHALLESQGIPVPAECKHDQFSKREHAKCPVQSAGATLIYQTGIKKSFQKTLKKHRHNIDFQSDKIFMYSAMAGAHNVGDSLARNHAKGGVTQWAPQLVKASRKIMKTPCMKVKKQFEAAQQMMGVTRCLTRGDNRPPHGISPELRSKLMGVNGPKRLRELRACQSRR